MRKWTEYIRRVVPYVPGEQPKSGNIIKLNTNENPYPPSPEVEKAIRDFDAGLLRRYPDPDVINLRRSIGNYHGFGPERVFVGVGSDDVLAMCFMTFFNGPKPILFADITYSFYEVWAALYGIPFKTCPLRDDLTIDYHDYMTENGGVVIANPNAPTSIALDISDIEEIISNNTDSVVIVDEAYIDFGGSSALALTDKYDNLIVCRTFSKSRALAGSRIGYAIASEELISCLLSVRNSFNSYTIDSLTSAIGIASISDDAYFKEQIQRVIDTRSDVIKRLKEMDFELPDPKANFVFARHKSMEAKKLFHMLRDRGIFVRFFDRPGINDRLRISIGTDCDMNELIRTLSEIL